MFKRIIAAITAIFTIAGSGTTVAKTITQKAVEPIKTATCSTSKPEKQGAAYALTYNEYTEVCQVVMAESGAEPYEGQMAVAQCILNSCRLENKRPQQVVIDNHYTKRRPEPSESVKNAVVEVFTDGKEVLDDRVTIFYAPDLCKSSYHESQVYSTTIGGHRFFIEERFV